MFYRFGDLNYRKLHYFILFIAICVLSACNKDKKVGLIAGAETDSFNSSATTSSMNSSSSEGSEEVGFKIGSGENAYFITAQLNKTDLQPRENLNVVLTFRDRSGNLVAPVGDWSVSSECLRHSSATMTALKMNAQALAMSYTPETCAVSDTLEFYVLYQGEIHSFEETISISEEAVNQIVFIGINPDIIALQGSSLETQSVATFQVTGELTGEGLSQQQIEFELEGDTGGARLAETMAVTNAEGLVYARVIAGTTPGLVVVKARHLEAGLSANSSFITVSTGHTYPDKFRIGATVINPNAWNKINGEVSDITVALSDRVGNAVADGTRVRFFAEAGRIPDVCYTDGGTCTVTWESRGDQPPDGRIQIFATTKGIENFTDTNNNFVFDDEDIFNAEDDLDEPYADYNSNGMRELGEPLIDTNKNGAWSESDGLWNGPNCLHSSLCSNVEFADLGRQLTLYASAEDDPELCELGDFPNIDDGPIDVAAGGEFSFSGMFISDGNSIAENESGCDFGNPLPNGTQISFSVSEGSLRGNRSWTVSNKAVLPIGGLKVTYDANDEPGNAVLTLTIAVPGRSSAHIFEWPINIH